MSQERGFSNVNTTRNSLKTNGIPNGIFLSVFFGRNYRRNISVCNSVGNTDGYRLSIITDRITDGKFRINEKRAGTWGGGFGGWIFRHNHRRIQNLGPIRVTWPFHRKKYRRNHRRIWMPDPYAWRDRCTVKKYRLNHRGIWKSRSVQWRVDSPSQLATDSPTYSPTVLVRRWVRWKQWIYGRPADTLLRHFSFFFLILSLPICK